ncbi:MAG: DAK2 domain-containing protein [Pseudonocardiales bacterium]|nr:DAK2 domain-containing protein [Pseudonocardiales bacterium]
MQSLDGPAVRRWAATCCDTLAAHRDEIDALNVFPVPDQDTGSNLLATMRAGLDAVLRAHRDDRDVAPGSTVAMLARGALMGARGNSGVILSQVLRGLAEPLLGADPQSQATAWDGAGLRAGLCRADELARAAVSDPVPGTVLTVLHAAAQAAAAVPSDDLGEVASAATAAASGALADTPRQLAALATAGVVDAGGRGLTLLLEALLGVVSERPGARPEATADIRPRVPQAVPAAMPVSEGGATAYEYEVMYLLAGADDTGVSRLRAELATLGDCVAVVGTSPAWDGPSAGRAGNRITTLWKVHVHCSDVGAAIDAGMRAGRPHRITVMRFADQVPDRAGAQDRYRTDHAVFVLACGTGVAQLCRREGAVTAPATSNVADLLVILAATRARHVTMLAEPSATRAAEDAAAQARDTGHDVVVVVAPSAVQVLAAVAVHDSTRHPVEDRAAMSEAATATRCGELTTIRGEPGGFVGILGDQVVVSNRDALAATRELVARLLAAGGELVTVLLGQDAPDGLAEVLTEQLRAAHPEIETMCYAGDVPQRVLLVGVE